MAKVSDISITKDPRSLGYILSYLAEGYEEHKILLLPYLPKEYVQNLSDYLKMFKDDATK